MTKTIFIGFTGMNNLSRTMDVFARILSEKNIEKFDRKISFGYDKFFSLEENRQEVKLYSDFISSFDKVVVIGYSFGAMVALNFISEFKKISPDLIDRIKLRLITPYFNENALKRGVDRFNMSLARKVPSFLAERLDFRNDAKSRKIQDAIRKDFENLKECVVDFSEYRENSEKIYAERNLAKIIAEAKAMSEELPAEAYSLGIKDVKVFTARKDEFLENITQEIQARKIFGETVEIIRVNSTNTGFPFEKEWIENMRSHF